jgi:hypothetical protein
MKSVACAVLCSVKILNAFRTGNFDPLGALGIYAYTYIYIYIYMYIHRFIYIHTYIHT